MQDGYLPKYFNGLCSKASLIYHLFFFTSLYYDCLEIKKTQVSFEKKKHLISEELNSKVDFSFFTPIK